MFTINLIWKAIRNCRFLPLSARSVARSNGQALVEFVLVFIILLIVSWIPADFGLAFMSGQLASNAAREGARIGSADPSLTPGTVTCTMPCSSAAANTPLKLAAQRMSWAPLSNTQISITLSELPACNQFVTATVSGTYNFFFYQLLHLMGASGSLDNKTITRTTVMRWEHQC
jgi:Flp pilus assembly protein TadG